MELVINISECIYKAKQRLVANQKRMVDEVDIAIANGIPLTPNVLADALMEERIRGELNSDTTFEKDIIRDVKCRLTVDIIDHRSCCCGAGLREVWRESEG